MLVQVYVLVFRSFEQMFRVLSWRELLCLVEM